MNEPDSIQRRASLGRALRRGFRDAYDHLGYVVFVTFISFMFTAGVVTPASLLLRHARLAPAVHFPLLALATALAALAPAVGVFFFVNKSVYHEQPVLADTWAGVRRLLGPAIVLFAADALVSAVLIGDLVLLRSIFAGTTRALFSEGFVCANRHFLDWGRGNLLFGAFTVLLGYLSLIWAMMAMYHLPLLAAQLKMPSGPRASVILRKSFLLAADNPGFTVGLFAVIIAFAVVCAIPGLVGMAILYLGAAAFLLTHALRELFARYGIVEEEPEVLEDKPWRLPS